MKGYGSFCPVAKAAEVLAERWTLLILRDILLGSHHFNELRRSIPKLSPTLLAKRLKTLEENGVLSRVASVDSHGYEYQPTPACEELRPLIAAFGHWGQRWVRSKLTRDELDPVSLMWYVHRHIKTELLPQRRIVIQVEFTDIRKMKRWWMVVEGKQVDLCLEDPGHEVDVSVSTDLLSLTQVYMGDVPLDRARSSGKIKVSGPAELVRNMPHWFARSKFADVNPLVPA
jgi:DNA-binding HxlR family transcriptional regulator